LTWVQEEAYNANVLGYAMEDSLSSYHLLRNLDKNRKFRTIHWDLTKAYIITKSKHPIATGGTPIISWLPN
jgi:indoleamine 2,3-dioxygenase